MGVVRGSTGHVGTDAALPAALRADCSRCAALCCKAPPFDAVQGFGFDKPAHQACRLLQADNRCSIHARLVEHGFRGCAAYDCHGAGQWVTAHFGAALTGSALWDAFLRLRPLHELTVLLVLAERRYPQVADLAALRQALEAVRAAEEQGTPLFQAAPWRQRVHAALRALA